jgi:CubicO group peptidase (beta-lactamase class C family)
MLKPADICGFLFSCTMLLNVSAQTGETIPELVNFDAAMLELIDEYDVPGAQLAITYQGRLIYNRGFGYADVSEEILVQPDHIFRIASLSKPITSIAVMNLLELGELSLDDLVFGDEGILNDGSYSDILDPEVYDITVRQLLDHSGGWNRDISGDPMFNSFGIAEFMGIQAPADAETVIQYVIANQMLDFTPGTQFQYSNLGYCILGRIIEEVTGINYEDYVKNTILSPLGIENMHCGLNREEDQLPMEVNYYDYPGAPYALSVYDNATSVPWPYGGFNIEAMDAHGAWVASAGDLCKLLVAVDGYPTKPDILQSGTIDIMTDPSMNEPLYALGWSVNPFNNWWHTGSLPGTMTEMVRASNQMNWAILLNTRNANSGPLINAVDALVWDVMPSITSWPELDLFTNVVDLEGSVSVNIYPNPSSGIFNIQSNNNIESIMIYNATGSLINTLQISNGMSYYQLNMSGRSSGIYFVTVVQNGNYCSSPIIIE